MIHIRLLLVGILTILPCLSAFGQKQNNVWEFGNELGIDFNSSKPVITIDGKLDYDGGYDQANPGFGDACISDPNTGKLLFYCSGHRSVFTKQHQRMRTPPDSSLNESAIIIPMGCDTTKYIICTNDDGWFTWDDKGFNLVDGPPVVAYSVVDMTLDSGNGAIPLPATELLKGASDRITAIPHANGTDSWIISHALHNKYYYAWHVSSRGVNPTPVLSYSDSTLGYPIPGDDDDEGIYVSSPDGQIVDFNGTCLLLHFDKRTGKVTFNKTIPHSSQMWSGCFSPDNSKFYGTTEKEIIQYDIASGISTTIVSNLPESLYVYGLGLAPDGKIYTCPGTASWLGVIENPNSLGVACNYQQFAVYLGGHKTSYDGGFLPANMNSFPDAIPQNCNTVTADFTAISNCSGKCISFSDWSNGSPTTWKWAFPGGNTSSDTGSYISSVCYDSSGLYPVTLIVSGQNGTDTMVKSILIDIGSRMANPITSILDATAGSQVTVPISLYVPATLHFDTTAVSEIDITLHFNQNVLDIRPADLPIRITPPLGWRAQNLSISSGKLSMQFINDLAIPVTDPLVLGQVVFDVKKTTLASTIIDLNSVLIRTPSENIDLCTDIEGSSVAIIHIDSSLSLVGSLPDEPHFEIRPNPAKCRIHLFFSDESNNFIDFELFDALGIVRKNGRISGKTYQIDASDLVEGNYYLRVNMQNGLPITKKIVLLK
jgi:PKD repeat protein